MKLYYAPGSCALAVHIALVWSGHPYELAAVDLSDENYRKINPMGSVPALIDGDSGVLTQAHALLNYVAAKFPEKHIAGKNTTPLDRQQMDQWLAFLNGDLHAAYMPIFRPDRYFSGDNAAVLDELKQNANKRLHAIFKVLDSHLADKDFIVGGQLTCADVFAYVITRWLPYTTLNIDSLPNLKRHFLRLRDEPMVVRAEEEQGVRE